MIWTVQSHRWAGIAAGILLLGFGLYCFVRPDLAVYTLARIFGSVLLVFAAGSVYMAVRMRGINPRWPLAGAQGAVFGLLALILLGAPDSILVFTRVVGIWAISAGLFRFFLGTAGQEPAGTVAAGCTAGGCSVAGPGLAVFFGMILFLFPMAFAGFLSVLLGILLIAAGAMLLAGSLSARGGTGSYF